MKAVILARISSKEQKEGHSLDAQIRNLRLYAERKNLEIVREYTLVESSTKRNRSHRQRAQGRCEGNQVPVSVPGND